MLATAAKTERIASQLEKPSGVSIAIASASVRENIVDPHPQMPAFVIGAIALILAATSIGSVLIIDRSTHSGVMIP